MDPIQLTYTNLLNSESSFTDLNEVPYDFPLSQYHSNGSTCEEMSANEMCTNEENAYGSNKAQRKCNFTTEEDKLLVSAWLNVSLDPVKGSDQKKEQFWKRITKYFDEHKKNVSGGRSEKSLTSRWSTISRCVSKFCGVYSQIEHLRRSGFTEQDKLAEAKEKYKQDPGHPFQLDHCWVVLRFQQKWMDEHKRIGIKNLSKTASGKTPDSINLEDDDVEAPQPAGLKRPIGRKAAKEVIKKAKSNEEASGSETPSKTRAELEEFRAMKLERERKRNDQLELLIATEQKQVALREKEIELQTRSEDAKIMAMDTSVMNPIQAEYFRSLQKEILAKRVGGNENH